MEDVLLNDSEKFTKTEGSMTLRTEGLVKRYGKRTVVNDVSINVRQGEIVGLLGPNGAGKTTSFYMTTGLIIPNAGHRVPVWATCHRRLPSSANLAWKTISWPFWR